MRTFWFTILVLVVAGGVALFFVAPQRSDDPTTDAIDAADSTGMIEVARSAPAVDVQQSGAQPDRPVGEHVQAAPPTLTAGDLTLGLDATIKDATVRAGTLVQNSGSISADGTFNIPGAGTKESPYEVTWELLVSASDTYIPRLGEKVIPQRIAMLHGKYVRISGFIAFPLVTTESDECLVMLNQWDGCCIGVPPSPYDAVEVKLSTPADNSKRHIVRIGTIEGILRVDPYLVERWLVGLYTMDSATLSTEM